MGKKLNAKIRIKELMKIYTMDPNFLREFMLKYLFILIRSKLLELPLNIIAKLQQYGSRAPVMSS